MAPVPTTRAVVLALRSAVASHEILGDVSAIRMAPDVDGGVIVYVSSVDKLPGGASARYVSVAHSNDGCTSALYFDRASEECVAHDVDGPVVPMSLLRSLVDRLA